MSDAATPVSFDEWKAKQAAAGAPTPAAGDTVSKEYAQAEAPTQVLPKGGALPPQAAKASPLDVNENAVALGLNLMHVPGKSAHEIAHDIGVPAIQGAMQTVLNAGLAVDQAAAKTAEFLGVSPSFLKRKLGADLSYKGLVARAKDVDDYYKQVEENRTFTQKAAAMAGAAVPYVVAGAATGGAADAGGAGAVTQQMSKGLAARIASWAVQTLPKAAGAGAAANVLTTPMKRVGHEAEDVKTNAEVGAAMGVAGQTIGTLLGKAVGGAVEYGAKVAQGLKANPQGAVTPAAERALNALAQVTGKTPEEIATWKVLPGQTLSEAMASNAPGGAKDAAARLGGQLEAALAHAPERTEQAALTESSRAADFLRRGEARSAPAADAKQALVTRADELQANLDAAKQTISSHVVDPEKAGGTLRDALNTKLELAKAQREAKAEKYAIAVLTKHAAPKAVVVPVSRAFGVTLTAPAPAPKLLEKAQTVVSNQLKNTARNEATATMEAAQKALADPRLVEDTNRLKLIWDVRKDLMAARGGARNPDTKLAIDKVVTALDRHLNKETNGHWGKYKKVYADVSQREVNPLTDLRTPAGKVLAKDPVTGLHVMPASQVVDHFLKSSEGIQQLKTLFGSDAGVMDAVKARMLHEFEHTANEASGSINGFNAIRHKYDTAMTKLGLGKEFGTMADAQAQLSRYLLATRAQGNLQGASEVAQLYGMHAQDMVRDLLGARARTTFEQLGASLTPVQKHTVGGAALNEIISRIDTTPAGGVKSYKGAVDAFEANRESMLQHGFITPQQAKAFDGIVAGMRARQEALQAGAKLLTEKENMSTGELLATVAAAGTHKPTALFRWFTKHFDVLQDENTQRALFSMVQSPELAVQLAGSPTRKNIETAVASVRGVTEGLTRGAAAAKAHPENESTDETQ